MRKKQSASQVATLIGDLVDSRGAPQRRRLHEQLTGVLHDVDSRTDPVHPAWVPAGDEFQATYRSVGDAVRATVLIRLAMAPVSLRFGIGWGGVTVLDDHGVQDGPGWWAAREALKAVEADERKAALRTVRTAYRPASGAGGPDADAVNAALLCQDAMLGSLDDRANRILKGLMDGMTQADIAAAEGISTSAVSQRVRSDRLVVLVRALELLGKV